MRVDLYSRAGCAGWIQEKFKNRTADDRLVDRARILKRRGRNERPTTRVCTNEQQQCKKIAQSKERWYL
jgi:hypothetical protein